MLRFARAAAQADDIVLAARSSIAGPAVLNLRVFVAPDTEDVYVLAEGYLGLAALLSPDSYGETAARIDMINLYVRC